MQIIVFLYIFNQLSMKWTRNYFRCLIWEILCIAFSVFYRHQVAAFLLTLILTLTGKWEKMRFKILKMVHSTPSFGTANTIRNSFLFLSRSFSLERKHQQLFHELVLPGLFPINFKWHGDICLILKKNENMKLHVQTYITFLLEWFFFWFIRIYSWFL